MKFWFYCLSTELRPNLRGGSIPAAEVGRPDEISMFQPHAAHPVAPSVAEAHLNDAEGTIAFNADTP